MTFDPPLPNTVPVEVAEQIPQQLDLGKWVVLGFNSNQRMTHFLAYDTERERNGAAAALNRTPGASVRLFNPNRLERAQP